MEKAVLLVSLAFLVHLAFHPSESGFASASLGSTLSQRTGWLCPPLSPSTFHCLGPFPIGPAPGNTTRTQCLCRALSLCRESYQRGTQGCLTLCVMTHHFPPWLTVEAFISFRENTTSTHWVSCCHQGLRRATREEGLVHLTVPSLIHD